MQLLKAKLISNAAARFMNTSIWNGSVPHSIDEWTVTKTQRSLTLSTIE
jgi:hypothetical protein